MEKPKELPLGAGEEFQKERKKLTLPAVEVANAVDWVNPAFKKTAPFNLKEGKPTKLAFFFLHQRQKHLQKGSAIEW